MGSEPITTASPGTVAARQGRSDLRDLTRVTRPDGRLLVERVLNTARTTLGMQVAYIAEWVGDDGVYRGVDRDDSEAFAGVRVGASAALDPTYCRQVVSGAMPPLAADARHDPRTREFMAAWDAEVGAICTVPLRLSDGRIWGTFCVLGTHPDPVLSDRDVAFMEVLGQLVVQDVERRALEERALRSQLAASSVLGLVAALDARDDYTADHSDALVALADRVATRLGLPEAEVRDVRWVALLHDIGKVGVPDAVLHKPGRLDPEEWALMRRHPEIGARIVADLEGLDHLACAIRADHERWDGQGYPDGLAGTEIPLASRITLACDAYHAMVSDRPYRTAMRHEDAVRELRRHAGTQFDPQVVAALLDVFDPDVQA